MQTSLCELHLGPGFMANDFRSVSLGLPLRFVALRATASRLMHGGVRLVSGQRKQSLTANCLTSENRQKHSQTDYALRAAQGERESDV